MAGPDLSLLQHLTDAGWPALETQSVGDWRVRFSSGLTRRANSVLPLGAHTDPDQMAAVVSEVEHRSAERWLAPTFQLWRTPSGDSTGQGPDDVAHGEWSPRHRALAEYLTGRGYREVAPTEVLWLEVADLPQDVEWDRRIVVNDTPDPAWMSALGRGMDRDLDAASELVLRRLLGGVRSRFHRLADPAGEVAALAKVSLVADPQAGSEAVFGGIYSMWVDPQHRRQGLARAVLHGILHQARQLGLRGLWLQVEHTAPAARRLYLQEGFRPVARYSYLTRTTGTPTL